MGFPMRKKKLVYHKEKKQNKPTSDLARNLA